MKTYNIYKSIVFTITTGILFFLWSLLLLYYEGNIFLGGIITLLTSIGTYRAIAKGMEWVLYRISFIKKRVFGNCYLEGCWVGCYRNINNEPNYFIEYFEQSFDSLVIRGKCFDKHKSYKGGWISDNVVIDEVKGTITYTYETEMINNTHKNQGLSVFNFYRESVNKAPTKLFGFSSDIFSASKTPSVEMKIEEFNSKTEQELLGKSVQMFAEHQEYFHHFNQMNG